MKKIVCFGLCMMIVLCSFVLSFAMDITNSAAPVLVPVTEDPTQGLLTWSGVSDYTVSTTFTGSAIYFTYFYNPDTDAIYEIFFSNSPGATAITYNVKNGSSTLRTLNSFDGQYYYYRSLASGSSSYLVIPYFTYSGTFDISAAMTYLTDLVYTGGIVSVISSLVSGSISWVTVVADSVVLDPLLLFLILSIFIGIGVGLFRRFSRG